MNDKKPHWAETASLIYAVLPVFFFFTFFVRLSIGILACVFIAACIVDVVRKTQWGKLSIPSRKTIYVLALALAWLLLAGNFGGLRQNGDWPKHYSILNYLASHQWPAIIRVKGLEGEWAVHSRVVSGAFVRAQMHKPSRTKIRLRGMVLDGGIPVFFGC
jgi:amino acid transporter